MRTLLVMFCVVVLASLGVSPPARAQFGGNITAPAGIWIVGTDASGVPDPRGEFVVIFRDLANVPVANAEIRIDFSGCTELRLCSDQHDPGLTVDCTARTVSRLTDANGVARFRVIGWSIATPGSPGSPYNCGKIFASGVMVRNPSVEIFDLDTHGLGAADLSAFLTDFFSGNNAARCDYDVSGNLGASDLSQWLTLYFAGGSPTNCTPEGPCP